MIAAETTEAEREQSRATHLLSLAVEAGDPAGRDCGPSSRDSTLDPGADADSPLARCGLEGALPTEFLGSGPSSFETKDRGKPSGSSSAGEFSREGLSATTGT